MAFSAKDIDEHAQEVLGRLENTLAEMRRTATIDMQQRVEALRQQARCVVRPWPEYPDPISGLTKQEEEALCQGQPIPPHECRTVIESLKRGRSALGAYEDVKLQRLQVEKVGSTTPKINDSEIEARVAAYSVRPGQIVQVQTPKKDDKFFSGLFTKRGK